MRPLIFIFAIIASACGTEENRLQGFENIVEVRYFNIMDSKLLESGRGDSLNMQAINNSRQVVCLVDSLSDYLPLLTSKFETRAEFMGGSSLVSFKDSNGKISYSWYYPETGVFRVYENESFSQPISIEDTLLRNKLIVKMNKCGGGLFGQKTDEKVRYQKAPIWKQRIKTTDNNR